MFQGLYQTQSEVFATFRMKCIITWIYVIVNHANFIHSLKNLSITNTQVVGNSLDA